MKIDKPPILFPEQCRAARAALRWSVADLATSAGLAENTVTAFELGRSVRDLSMLRIKYAFEKAGCSFGQNKTGRSVKVK